MVASARPSSVYGPVNSWRFGRSLGIDPIVDRSVCSFNCIYCQLGQIQDITLERRVFIPVDWLYDDLTAVKWADVDVVTISGNGEPTLAANLDDLIETIREFWSGPLHLLTNATLLYLPEVRAMLQGVDFIACKLDAPDQESLVRMNRVAGGVTFENIIAGILALRREWPGELALQVMVMPGSLTWIDGLVEWIRRIAPDSVQLNTPRRAYPLDWALENRGAQRSAEPSVRTRRLRVIEPDQAREIAQRIREQCGVNVVDVYRDDPAAPPTV